MGKNIAIIFLFACIVGSTTSVYSQNAVAQRQLASEKAVPKIVLSTFVKQYPDVVLKGWKISPVKEKLESPAWPVAIFTTQ